MGLFNVHGKDIDMDILFVQKVVMLCIGLFNVQ